MNDWFNNWKMEKTEELFSNVDFSEMENLKKLINLDRSFDSTVKSTWI